MQACSIDPNLLFDLVLWGFYTGIALAFGMWFPGAIARLAGRRVPEAD